MSFKIVGIKFLLIICLSVCMRKIGKWHQHDYTCLVLAVTYVFVALGAGAADGRVNSPSLSDAQQRAYCVIYFYSTL